MTPFLKDVITSKWLLVIQEYELVKQKKSANFDTVQQICQAYKVHRKDIRKYYERWIKSNRNKESLFPLKRGPKPGQLKVLSKQEERIIVHIHRRLQANRFEIQHFIKGNQNFKLHPSVTTIYRTIKRFPLNKKRKELVKRYEKLYPGEMAHTDTYYLPKTLFIERSRFYLFALEDDYSRLCYTQLIDNITAPTVTKACFNAYKWFSAHGIKIECVLSDNGSEFTAFTSQKAKETHFFETMLAIFDIKHKYIRPYKPQTNGKVERFWKILYNELIRVQTVSLSKQEFVNELNSFMYYYNYQRRHGGINYVTPLDRLNSFVNLLPKL